MAQHAGTHDPWVACLFRDTDIVPLRQFINPGITARRRAGRSKRQPLGELPWHASCTYPVWDGYRHCWGRQRGVSAIRYYVPQPCLLSRSRMMVAKSSDIYTGSAAVGEPFVPPNRRQPTPLKFAAGREKDLR